LANTPAYYAAESIETVKCFTICTQDLYHFLPLTQNSLMLKGNRRW